jgi:AraC-like DNA-binding protein
MMHPFYENRRGMQAGGGADFHFQPHFHSRFEFVYAKEPITVEVDGTVYPLGAGDLVVMFPNRIHAYHGGGAFTLVVAGLESCGAFAEVLSAGLPQSPLIPASSVHPDVPFALSSLEEEMKKRTPSKSAEILLQLILSRILPELTVEKDKSRDGENLAGRVTEYVAEHFREDLSLSLVAEAFHVSKYHLSHVFSSKIGMGFSAYLGQIRVEYAASLIRTTTRSLTDIWLAAGFDSQRTFNRVFRAAFGTSPSEYRRG